MATARLNAACRLRTSRRSLDCNSYVGLRARTVRISYARTEPAPRRHLVLRANEDRSSVVITAAAASGEMQEKRYPGESEGFVEEMKLKAIKMHTKDQAKEGQRESNAPEDGPVAKWELTVERCLRFLVDNKLLYDTLERIIDESTVPTYAVFKNTGLERAENLSRDLEWFKEQGYEIPEPMTPGKVYSEYLEDIADKDSQAFICHFYNIYFAQSAGGRLVGKKLSEKILDNRELDFYKWDGEISQMLQNAKENLNKIAELWTREEKNHCLEETEISFKYSRAILRLLLS